VVADLIEDSLSIVQVKVQKSFVNFSNC
jgi:hypothetical protein